MIFLQNCHRCVGRRKRKRHFAPKKTEDKKSDSLDLFFRLNNSGSSLSKRSLSLISRKMIKKENMLICWTE